VERYIAAGDRRAEGAAGIADAAAGLGELEEDMRTLGAAEVEAVGDPQRARAGAGHVARRLGDRRLAALVRIEATSRLLQSTVTASANDSPSTRRTPASPPGPMTVEVWTVESYCSKTHRLLAIEGTSSSASNAPPDVASGRWRGLARRRGGRGFAPPASRSGSHPPGAGPGFRRP
jgi:hypothetical protein